MLNELHLTEEDGDPGEHGQGDDKLNDGQGLAETSAFGGSGECPFQYENRPEPREHQGGIATCQQRGQGKEQDGDEERD